MPRPAMRTFLFSDLRDYTAFIETRGDEAATKMLRASRRIVRQAVAKQRGAEVKTEGDSFYVVFRSPSPAVRCAIDIQRAAAAHNDRHPDVPVRMGIGINTGEAMPHDKGYVGSAVIVASRLCTSAKPGQILVTDTVRSLVRTGAHASMRDLGAWTLKGVAQPIRVYEVDIGHTSAARALGPALSLPPLLTQVSALAPGIVVCPELVQRERELSVLVEQLSAASKGEARIVAVAGEGGIGKSRLCRELAEIAQREGFYVLAGRSHGSGAPPYEPFVAALRGYAQVRGTEVLRRMLGTLVSELQRLLPEIDIPTPPDGGALPDEERRDRFFRTLHLLLEDAASLRPVLLVLEDVHEADAASHDLLRYLASSLRTGICLVLTYREEDIVGAHPLRSVLGQLDRDRRLARLHLEPLDRDGVARMTAALVPGRDTSELARAIFERSEGVPYYVEELLKTALDDPNATAAHLPLPRTVADSVQVRVGRLVEQRGAEIAELIEAMAVAAVPLSYDVVLRLSPRTNEPEAAADLAACVESQLLERPATRTERYQFRHALTREAVAAAIPPPRVRRLHIRVAKAVEALGPTAEHAALLARHFAAGGDHSTALRYAREGAAAATRIGAYASAIELLQEAVEHAGGTPGELAALEDLAVALRAAGRASEAERVIERARIVAREHGAPRDLARLDVLLGSILRIEGRRSEALIAIRRAVTALEDRRDEHLAHALVTEAELHWAENEAERAADVAARALSIARENAADPVTVAALTIRGAALARLGDPVGIEDLREAIRLCLERDLSAETVNAYLELSRAQSLRGESEQARRAAEDGLLVAREHGLEFAQARILAQLVRLRLNEGRPREAQALAEQAVALARPGTIAAGAAKIALADVLTNRGDASGAIAILDQIEPDIELTDPERRMIFYVNRTAALLALGRADEAKGTIEQAIRMTVERPGQGVSAFVQAVDLAEVLRDPTWARWLSAIFESYFRGRESGGIRAVRAELAAVDASITGRDPAADFQRAAAEYEALGAKHRGAYRRATSLFPQLAEPETCDAARAELIALRTYLAEWGAVRYAAVIDAALARPRESIEMSQGVLDERELRVAMLLSRGLTDGRIAAEMGVTPRHASRLVREVLRKLGVESRSQVASWIVGRGLAETAPVS